MKCLRGLNKIGQSGSGLLEAAIACAILCFVAIVIATQISSQNQINFKIQGAGSCRNNIENIVQEFKDSSNSAIVNFIPGVGGSRALVSVGSEISYDTVVNSSQYRNHQNIENAVTRALILYNNNNNFCVGDGIEITDSNKSAILNNPSLFDSIKKEQKRVFLNLTPVQGASQTTLCGQAQGTSVTPLSNANQSSDLGFNIKVKIISANNDTCVAESVLKYTSDFTNPVLSTANMTPNNASCSINSVITASEPGALFECSLDNSNYKLCDNAHISTLSPGLNSAMNLINAGSGARDTKINLNVSGFGVGAHNLYIKAIDTAGNRSAASSATVTCVAGCTSTWTAPTCQCGPPNSYISTDTSCGSAPIITASDAACDASCAGPTPTPSPTPTPTPTPSPTPTPTPTPVDPPESCPIIDLGCTTPGEMTCLTACTCYGSTIDQVYTCGADNQWHQSGSMPSCRNIVPMCSTGR